MKDPTGKMTNSAAKGGIFGKPGFGTGLVTTQSGESLGFAAIAETFGDRLELGYGYDAFYLGDLPGDIRPAIGVDIRDGPAENAVFSVLR